MDEGRRTQLFDDAINRPASASTVECVLGCATSWGLGVGFVSLLAWLLSVPVREAPIAYAIVFAAVSLTVVVVTFGAYIGQSIADLARGAKAIALARSANE